jgi:polyisoprenoid-binding protein YceI
MIAAVILTHAIAAHMRFLASDQLEGRETGSRGYEIAAQYVRTQFDSIGLETSFQPVDFRAAKLIEEQSTFAIDGEALTLRKDVLLHANFLSEVSDVSAPVVFAGFGITAPELKHDDYASIDAKGKIVLILSGAPPEFPTDQRAFYSAGKLKEQNARRHGAVAVLTMLTPIDEQRSPFAKRAQQSGIPPMLYLDHGKPADAIEGIRAAGTVSEATGERLRNGAHTVTIHTVSQFSEAKSENVIGVLPGSSPETVVVSAHLDHLGDHARPNSSDAIYNGAYDNASGIACLIEIARALAAGPRPKRTVAFVAFTGEEKGDQGSEYFARHPILKPLVADVNMDMFLMLYPVADLVALGGEHTSLGDMAAKAAHDAGFEMSPDPLPEEVRFIRSDQFSFVEEGIPAIHLKPGNKSRDAKVDGATLTRDWLRKVYHSPADDMNQHFDFDSGARYADTNLRLVRAVANAPEAPSWKKGDFFAPPATPDRIHISRFDTNHSTVGFRIPILNGMSEVTGKFADFSGDVVYDRTDPAKSSVVAIIKTASIDTGIAARDNDLRSASFFDAEKFPEIRYESTRIEKTTDGWRALGNLTMHGVTRPVTLDLRTTGLQRNEEKKSFVAGFSAVTRLNRRDFGMNWTHSADPMFVGDDVTIEIHLISRLTPLQ